MLQLVCLSMLSFLSAHGYFFAYILAVLLRCAAMLAATTTTVCTVAWSGLMQQLFMIASTSVSCTAPNPHAQSRASQTLWRLALHSCLQAT